MTLAALLIACVTYLSDWSAKDIFTNLEYQDTDMSDYGIFVNADEDQADAAEQQLRRLAEKEEVIGERQNYRHPWPTAFCVRGSSGCKGPYTRRKIFVETEDEYGTKSYTWDREYESREIGISYAKSTSY